MSRSSSPPRERAARAAVARYAAMDPAGWGTGLSDEGARAALTVATGALLRSPLPGPRGLAPERLVIWCAGNVFTAPMEWVTIFSALGSDVILKAPSDCPAPVMALAEAFQSCGLPVVARAERHEDAGYLLEGADAVLGFGSDAAMASLSAQLGPGVRRSMHGHRASFAVVQGSSPALAQALALDAALYDGRGCMSPAAIFCLGDARALAVALAEALEALRSALPRGEVPPEIGPRWREICGLARIFGVCVEGDGWAVPLLPPDEVRAGALPRLVPVHPIADLDALVGLSTLPLSSCATDLLDPTALVELGFDRICRPGELQAPPPGRPHDGIDVIRALSRQISLEL